MRIAASILLLLLLGLSSPGPVRAETTIYFVGHAWEVPPPVMLVVGGLALIAIGSLIRKWVNRTQAPESEPDDVKADVKVTGPIPEFSSAMLDLHRPDEKHADQDRTETSRPAA